MFQHVSTPKNRDLWISLVLYLDRLMETPTYGRFRALGYIKIKTMGFRIKNMLKLHKLPILDHLGVLHFHNFHDPINQVCTMGCHGAPRSNHIQWHSPAMMPL